MATTRQVTASGTKLIDDLLGSRQWNNETISFGFSRSAKDYGADYGRGETDSFRMLNAAQQQATLEAMEMWNELIDLDIVQTEGAVADIRLGVSSQPTTAWAYMPSAFATGGDLWLGTKYMAAPEQGNYAYFSIIHELGHALGLSHPHDSSISVLTEDGLCPCCAGILHGQGNGNAANVAAATAGDAMQYSVMSYRSFEGKQLGQGYTNETFGYAQTPMVRDIAALQHMYGANYETRATSTVYSWNPTTGEKYINGFGQGKPGANKVFETVWDGGGDDTFDLSNFSSNLEIDLTPGGWTDFGSNQLANLGNGNHAPGNVAVAMLHQNNPLALIENAIGGTGNDSIVGNSANNLLVGNGGDDTLYGISGRNVLVGDGIGNELELIGLIGEDFLPAILPTVPAQAGDNVLIGGMHNDIFIPGFGNNEVRGGEGTDTLVFDLALNAIKLSSDTEGGLSIIFEGGSVQFTGVEILAVQDGFYSLTGSVLGFETRQFADEITLLYRAGLGRSPDAEGLGYWADALDNGTGLDQIALSLLDSPEFTGRFGTEETLNDTDFLNALYGNVLGREADADGIAYWQDQVDLGVPRGDLLMAFTFSDENRGNVAAADSGVDLVAVSDAQWAELWG